METHSNILVLKTPRIEEPGGLYRVGCDSTESPFQSLVSCKFDSGEKQLKQCG